MIKISTGLLLISAVIYLGSRGTNHTICDTNKVNISIQDTIINKETKDWTGTTQGERTYEEQLSIEPDYMYYDTTESQREADSVDAYMRHWYEVLDTNSDGDIDGDYDMGCGGKVHDTIIEWLEE